MKHKVAAYAAGLCVIEYQRRGLIHFHAVVRLDAKTRLHLQKVEPGVIQSKGYRHLV
ncbi:hypothetical protein GCM10010187_57450 [Actinomadura coerulea]|nr:hypothetical protein GCM10010187_57450 [Actinomadura coerulea]